MWKQLAQYVRTHWNALQNLYRQYVKESEPNPLADLEFLLGQVNSLETLERHLSWLFLVQPLDDSTDPQQLSFTKFKSIPETSRLWLRWPTKFSLEEFRLTTPLEKNTAIQYFANREEILTLKELQDESLLSLANKQPVDDPSLAKDFKPLQSTFENEFETYMTSKQPSHSSRESATGKLFPNGGGQNRQIGPMTECRGHSSHRRLLEGGGAVYVDGALVEDAFNRRLVRDGKGQLLECFDYFPSSAKEPTGKSSPATQGVAATRQKSPVKNCDPLGAKTLAGLAACGALLSGSFVLQMLWLRSQRKSPSGAKANAGRSRSNPQQKQIGPPDQRQVVTDLDEQCATKPQPKFCTRPAQ
eukprot:GHVT01054909.1.p1 GENE.GHVT01054909.1~~GHVT01054909.1.p1  ORF type:complete len:358 (-),score=66.12 GHVT01054909.1:1730-2803(-)